MRRTFLASLALALTTVACSSASSSANAGPCNPLTSTPTSLGNVVGAAKDASGVVYVVDQPQSATYRVFVTRGGHLVRESSSGFGQSKNPDGSYSTLIEFADPGADSSTTRTVFLTIVDDKATSMQLGHDAGSSDVKGGTPDETLTMVDPSTVSGLPVDNLARTVWLVSDISDGSVLVLTLSGDDDEGTDQAALFYGPPSSLRQSTIDKLSQSGSGDVYVTFDLPAGTYDAHLANGVPPDPSYPSPSFDTIDTPKGTLTTSERACTSLDGLTFVCS